MLRAIGHAEQITAGRRARMKCIRLVTVSVDFLTMARSLGNVRIAQTLPVIARMVSVRVRQARDLVPAGRVLVVAVELMALELNKDAVRTIDGIQAVATPTV